MMGPSGWQIKPQIGTHFAGAFFSNEFIFKAFLGSG
jgi:hypothetical protein